MNKNNFSKVLKQWLITFIKKDLPEHRLLEVISPNRALSHINNKFVRQLSGSTTWEFSPDILALLKHENSKRIETIFLNRATKSISLKDLGELRIYATIAKPIYTFMASTKGSSNELNLLLLDDNIRKRCLKYHGNQSIIIFGWDEQNNVPRLETVLPIGFRAKILKNLQ